MRKTWNYPLPRRTKSKYAAYTAWDIGDMAFRYGYYKRLPEVPETKMPRIRSDGLIGFGEPSIGITYDSILSMEPDPEEI